MQVFVNRLFSVVKWQSGLAGSFFNQFSFTDIEVIACEVVAAEEIAGPNELLAGGGVIVDLNVVPADICDHIIPIGVARFGVAIKWF